MALTDEKLLEAGLHSGLLETVIIDKLKINARRQHCSVLELVLAHYRLPISTLHRAVAETHTLPYLESTDFFTEEELLKKLPSSLVKRKLIIPVNQNGTLFLIVSELLMLLFLYFHRLHLLKRL